MLDLNLSHTHASGRIMVRQHQGAYSMLGILHFDAAFIEPLAGYGTLITEKRFIVLEDALHPRPADHLSLEGEAIDGFVRAPIWASFPVPPQFSQENQATQGVLVRFIEAWPEQHGWLMMAVMTSKPVFVDAFDAGHAWFEIEQGTLVPSDAPIPAIGKALSQIVSAQVIWPDRAGRLHRLCANEAKWRPAYFQQANLFADVGEGRLSLQDCRERIEKDEVLSLIHTRGLDINYCTFLAALRAEGGLLEERPMDKQAFQAHRDAVARAFRRSMGGRTGRVMQPVR